jgi:hypothetical protein
MRAFLRAFLPGEKLVLIVIALGVFQLVAAVVGRAMRILRTMRGTRLAAEEPVNTQHRLADRIG